MRIWIWQAITGSLRWLLWLGRPFESIQRSHSRGESASRKSAGKSANARSIACLPVTKWPSASKVLTPGSSLNVWVQETKHVYTSHREDRVTQGYSGRGATMPWGESKISRIYILLSFFLSIFDVCFRYHAAIVDNEMDIIVNEIDDKIAT